MIDSVREAGINLNKMTRGNRRKCFKRLHKKLKGKKLIKYVITKSLRFKKKEVKRNKIARAKFN